MRCVVEPVYHREKAVASSGSYCPKLNIIARLETFWKAALRSSATKTRVVSASAKYWMDLIICRLRPGTPLRVEARPPPL